MKRFVSILLSLVLLIGVPVVSASAADNPSRRFCMGGSCQNAVSVLKGYGCQDPSAALNLYVNTDSYCSLSDVLRKYGCSQKSCENIINALRNCGYDVDIVNEGGITVAPDPVVIETMPVETIPPSAAEKATGAPAVTETKLETQAANVMETAPVTESSTEPQRFTPNEYEQEVVRLVNEIRAMYLVRELTLSEELCEIAHIKAQDMSEKRYFDHTSPTYGSPFDMMKSFGISYRTAGENIAMGYRTPQQVVDAWMNSTAHRTNILNSNFTQIGVGYCENGHYWSQMFVG